MSLALSNPSASLAHPVPLNQVESSYRYPINRIPSRKSGESSQESNLRCSARWTFAVTTRLITIATTITECCSTSKTSPRSSSKVSPRAASSSNALAQTCFAGLPLSVSAAPKEGAYHFWQETVGAQVKYHKNKGQHRRITTPKNKMTRCTKYQLMNCARRPVQLSE